MKIPWLHKKYMRLFSITKTTIVAWKSFLEVFLLLHNIVTR